ncbi:MAG: metallophosphoesterase family protein [bacterium]
MKILVLADEERSYYWDYYEREKFEGIELILSAGDLKAEYLEFLVTLTGLPVLYICGNHDDYDLRAPEGCTCIENKIYNYHGLRILGLGGSYRYKPGPNMYSELEMRRRCHRASLLATMKNGFDILLSHSPVRGYGDMDDLPHRGFDCFNDFLNKWKPPYMLHGHVHKAYGHFQPERIHESGTKLINACGSYILDIPEDAYPAQGHTGAKIYDLYTAILVKAGRR